MCREFFQVCAALCKTDSQSCVSWTASSVGKFFSVNAWRHTPVQATEIGALTLWQQGLTSHKDMNIIIGDLILLTREITDYWKIILLCHFTNDVERCVSSEVHSLSAVQEIPFFLWNPMVHCRIHSGLLFCYWTLWADLYALKKLLSNLFTVESDNFHNSKRRGAGKTSKMRSSIICTLHQILLQWSNQEDEMGGECSAHDGDE
jgi:hypothetical protein